MRKLTKSQMEDLYKKLEVSVDQMVQAVVDDIKTTIMLEVKETMSLWLNSQIVDDNDKVQNSVDTTQDEWLDHKQA